MRKDKKNRKSKKIENAIIKTLNELEYHNNSFDSYNMDNVNKIVDLPIFPLRNETIEFILKSNVKVPQKVYFLDAIDHAVLAKKIKYSITREERYTFLKQIFEELKTYECRSSSLFLWTLKEYIETGMKNELIEHDFLCPELAGFDVYKTIKELISLVPGDDSSTPRFVLRRIKDSVLELEIDYFKNTVINFNIIGLKSKLEIDCRDHEINMDNLLIIPFLDRNTTAEEMLKYYRRLFDIGIGPNTRFENNKNFIQVIMEKHWYGNDMKFIYKLIELAIKYHFDVNEQPTLLPTLLNKNIDVYKFLKLFIDNGYNINKDNLDFFETIDKINTGYINNTNQMYKIAKFKGVIDILKLKLNEKGYEVVDNFEEVLLSMHEEFTDILFMLCSYYRYIIPAIGEEWSIKIIENRESYINDYDGPISVNETITGLHLFLDEIFSKINNDVEDCKQLSLKYEQ